MTETIGAYEAKTHLPRVLRRVQAGQVFDISVRGVAVARLMPLGRPQEHHSKAAAKMHDFLLAQMQAGAGAGVDLAAMIDEGRA